MIIVTGGAGFIGSNIVKQLNEAERSDILVVDNLKDGAKFKNLVDCEILDFVDKDDFLGLIEKPNGISEYVEAVIHQGACSDTTEWDGKKMMSTNYDYSKALLHFCLELRKPFIYASSAATYGGGTTFIEEPEYDAPLNLYGYSKSLFDSYVRRQLPKAQSQIVGLKYFNVYGPREQHKDRMASVAYHFHQQIKAGENVKLFAGIEGYGNGEQRRDFIYVGDVAKVNLWFLDHPEQSGIFNCGTGASQTFNEVAQGIIDWHGRGQIDYVPFPEDLRGRYQSFTQADVTKLRLAGYEDKFLRVEEGVKSYLDWLADA